MRTNEPRRISLILILLVAAFIMMLVIPAFASGDIIQSNDNNAQTTGDLVLGDNSISGSRSYGYSGPDVDIAQCYRSWSFFLQGSQPNYWCFADSLDSKGLHQAASMTRCNIKGYAKLFESRGQCLKLSLMKPHPVEPMPELVDNDDEDDHAEDISQLYALYIDLKSQRTQEVEKAQKVAKRANAAAQTAVQRTNEAQVSEQKRLDDDIDRRARARAAKQEALREFQ